MDERGMDLLMAMMSDQDASDILSKMVSIHRHRPSE